MLSSEGVEVYIFARWKHSRWGRRVRHSSIKFGFRGGVSPLVGGEVTDST